MNDELIMDLFAGGGGASTAILQATGRHPDVAVNHDADAVGLHRANHPNTLHYCCDIGEVDPVEVLSRFPGRRVGLLWASPDCTHHSKARGGKPAEKKIRALAWHVVRWAAAIKRVTGSPPRMIALENVEEFADWGPLGPDNRPIKSRRGETFKLWVSQLEGLGYRVRHGELIAADFGAPTTRKRLFLIARSDGAALTWPTATHGKRAKIADLFEAPLEPWRSAADDVIDWSLPTPSIFTRKRPLAPATRRRIAKGVKRFVIEAPRPFIVPLTHTGGDRLHDTAEPLRTITTANRGEMALAAPHITKFRPESSGASVEEPMPTVTANSFVKRPGGSPPIGIASAFMTPRYGEAPGQEPRALDVAKPYPTVVPDGNGGSLVAAHLLRTDMQSAAERNGIHSADEPVRTVTSAGGFAAAAIHLTKFSENSVGTDPADPLHTAMAGAPRHGVVAAYLGRQFGTSTGSDATAPVGTVMPQGAGKTQVVAPILDKYYAAGVAQTPDRPIDTVTAKSRFGLAAAHIEQANTGMVGHSVESPLSTIVGGGASSGWGTTQRLIETALGDEADPRRRAVLEFLWEHFGAPTEAEIADPAATPSGRLRFGIVILDEVEWRIVDIGMRMLVPRELYRAQGFPSDYVIDVTWEGRPLTKTAQTRMAGNSVSPPPAVALLRANLPAEMRREEAA